MSYSWYTRLEQGQDVHATANVIDSIATALQLTDDEHRYVRRLAGLTPGPHSDRDDLVDEHARQLLERLLPAPAYVVGPRFDYLAWNDALVAIFCDIGELPAHHRNVLWATFTAPRVRSSLVGWEDHARSVIGQFRAEAAAHPTDTRFSRIAEELSAGSPDFRRWWAAHEVTRAGGGTQEFQHPQVGRITTYLMQLRLIDRPALKVVVHLPATADDADKLEAVRGEADWQAVIGR